MTLIIVAILLLGYVLLATCNYTKINKAAVAIFIAGFSGSTWPTEKAGQAGG